MMESTTAVVLKDYGIHEICRELLEVIRRNTVLKKHTECHNEFGNSGYEAKKI